jgi:hypothetical protein
MRDKTTTITQRESGNHHLQRTWREPEIILKMNMMTALRLLLFGLPASLWYALSLLGASLVAHYYLRGLRPLAARARCAWMLLRVPTSARHLLALRNELIAEIDAARWQVPAEATIHEQKGSA